MHISQDMKMYLSRHLVGALSIISSFNSKSVFVISKNNNNNKRCAIFYNNSDSFQACRGTSFQHCDLCTNAQLRSATLNNLLPLPKTGSLLILLFSESSVWI